MWDCRTWKESPPELGWPQPKTETASPLEHVYNLGSAACDPQEPQQNARQHDRDGRSDPFTRRRCDYHPDQSAHEGDSDKKEEDKRQHSLPNVAVSDEAP